jgi:hypothetical protein
MCGAVVTTAAGKAARTALARVAGRPTSAGYR